MLLIHGICDSSSGYGQMTAALGRELVKLGVDVEVSSIYSSETIIPLDPFLADRLVDGEPTAPCLVMGAPWTKAPAGSIVLTMWESSRLPAKYLPHLNAAACVVVPCEANRDWFLASGVTAPIRVVPLGIDLDVHHPDGRTNDDYHAVRFGCSGRTVGRKGLFNVLVAFLAAFEPDNDRVALEVKIYEDCPAPEPDDPRVRIIRDPWTDRRLADWYRSLDVFVSASKGEGWGLQPHQAMACGTPVIAPIWGGHAAYMRSSAVYPVDFSERQAQGVYEAPGSLWCEAHHGSLVAQMQRAARSGRERKQKGFEAARIGVRFGWERSGRELAAVLEEFGLIGQPALAI